MVHGYEKYKGKKWKMFNGFQLKTHGLRGSKIYISLAAGNFVYRKYWVSNLSCEILGISGKILYAEYDFICDLTRAYFCGAVHVKLEFMCHIIFLYMSMRMRTHYPMIRDTNVF